MQLINATASTNGKLNNRTRSRIAKQGVKYWTTIYSTLRAWDVNFGARNKINQNEPIGLIQVCFWCNLLPVFISGVNKY